ncbi:MAG: FAD/NAD(P)-binding protein [Planctomycetota bacterium]|nr:FAD/NAD(P)-binding protein [Planctomycetota bacterium]
MTLSPTQSPNVEVAIIGGGFTGSMIAVNLLRLARERGQAPPSVALIEARDIAGPGLAYSTPDVSHLLNVPAGRMSALASDPDHFVRWCLGRELAVTGGTFVSRGVFGQYLQDILREHAASAPSFRVINGHAIDLQSATGDLQRSIGPWRLAIAPDRRSKATAELVAKRVVLALGNAPPCDFAWSRSLAPRTWIRDPWSADARRRVSELAVHDRVLIIGTGLTMMDLVLQLDSTGHRGSIAAISRRGLLSLPHRTLSKPYHRDRPGDLEFWPSTAIGYLRNLRRAVLEAAGKGVDWREVVTSIRQDTPALWKRLPLVEKQRFLRHLRPYWDTHRHRAAPEVAAKIDELMRSGRLTIRPARVVDAEQLAGGARLRIMPRGGRPDDVTTIDADVVINCTGPETSPAGADDPLVHKLISTGIARVDELALGLDSTPDYQVLTRSGKPAHGLLLVGPLQRPLHWECVAVPELRVHAHRAAELLLLSE